jgi:hypothetical protein
LQKNNLLKKIILQKNEGDCDNGLIFIKEFKDLDEVKKYNNGKDTK